MGEMPTWRVTSDFPTTSPASMEFFTTRPLLFEADSSTTGVVVGVVASALAVGFAALGFFLRRRRQAAKRKDADPSASPLDGRDNLEHGHGERQLDMSSSVPIVVAGGNGTGAGGPPPPAQQSSAPPSQPLPPPYAPRQRNALPLPPPYTHGATHLPDALPPAAADRQHAPTAAETDTGNDSKPMQSSLAAPAVGVLKKPSSEEETTPPRDKNGGGGGSSKTAGAGRGGGGDAAVEDGLRRTAEQVSLPRTATNSTADVSTEERTAELSGLGFSVDEGADHAPPPAAAAAAVTAAAASSRRKTSSGVEYGQAVLAAAEELAHHCQIPGVSEAATVVSILVHLVTDSRDSLSRGDAAVKKCRSIVRMLERAAKVLGKVSDTAPVWVCMMQFAVDSRVVSSQECSRQAFS